MRGSDPLDLILTNKEELSGDAKVKLQKERLQNIVMVLKEVGSLLCLWQG